MPHFVVDYQVLLGESARAAPAGHREAEIAGLKTAFDPRFRSCELRDSGGGVFATLLGYAYDKETKRFLVSDTFYIDRAIGDRIAFENQLIPRLAGAFLIVTHGSLPRRIYLDPGGSLPPVYSPQDCIAGSTASLLLDETAYEERFDRALYEAMIKREGLGGWISGTLTAHRGVLRLLPNHSLDLENWTTERYWPRPNGCGDWMPFDEAVETISGALQDFMRAFSAEFRVSLTLTAGFDSRLLLAASRDSACTYVTMDMPGGQIDVEVSSLIADRFDLRHQLLPLQEATESERQV